MATNEYQNNRKKAKYKNYNHWEPCNMECMMRAKRPAVITHQKHYHYQPNTIVSNVDERGLKNDLILIVKQNQSNTPEVLHSPLSVSKILLNLKLKNQFICIRLEYYA